MVSNKQVIFSKYPTAGSLLPGVHIQVIESTIDLDASLAEGEFILKTLELAIDPYVETRLRDPAVENWSPPIPLNDVIADETLSVVVRSNSADYKVGDLVYSYILKGHFAEYVKVTAEYAAESYVVRNEARESKLPLSHYVSVLGMSGMTAYSGIITLGDLKKGETLYVSAASGNVGLIAGQIGKSLGCYVVGSAGSQEKIEYLKSAGFDAVFNYKEGDIEENLRKHCPKGIDAYFESVGGKMLDAVLAVANKRARIAVCSMLTQFDRKPYSYANIAEVVFKCIRMEGFFVYDNLDREPEFINKVSSLLSSGQMKYKEHIIHGIDNVPQAFCDVFQGKHFGKTVVHVADL